MPSPYQMICIILSAQKKSKTREQIIPNANQNSLPDGWVWHRACYGNGPNHGRQDNKEVRCLLSGTFPGHERQYLLAKLQDRRGAPLLDRWPRSGDVRSKGGNGTAVIKMIATFQGEVTPYHGFPAFARFCVFYRSDEPVSQVLQTLFDRLDYEVITSPKVPVEAAMRQPRSLHQCAHRRPVQPLRAQLTGSVFDDSPVRSRLVISVITHGR